MSNNWGKPVKFLFFAAAAVLIAGLLGLVVMLLWNALLPDILGVKSITFWQALGLLILSRILFGGFKGKSRRHRGKPGSWKEKWGGFTESDKEDLKRKWKEKCEG